MRSNSDFLPSPYSPVTISNFQTFVSSGFGGVVSVLKGANICPNSRSAEAKGLNRTLLRLPHLKWTDWSSF